jgi:hypothetical protein
MMNKSLRARERESSRKRFYGFQRGDKGVPNRTAAVPGGLCQKKQPPYPAAFAEKRAAVVPAASAKKRAAISGGF